LVEQLAFAWMEDSTTETVRAGVDANIDRFVQGDLEHGSEVILALLKIATGEEDVKAPEKDQFAVSLTRVLR
jgi:hypothetical protein